MLMADLMIQMLMIQSRFVIQMLMATNIVWFNEDSSNDSNVNGWFNDSNVNVNDSKLISWFKC
jgi:hypothetical protein